jgi:hypothetical protein
MKVRNFFLYILLAGSLAECKKAETPKTYSYSIDAPKDISLKQYEIKVLNDTFHVRYAQGANEPLTVKLVLPSGVWAEPSVITATPPFDAVFTLHCRVLSSGLTTAKVQTINTAGGTKETPFNFNVGASTTPCVDKVTGYYTGADACSPAHGDAGFDATIYTPDPSWEKVYIRLPLGTLTARVNCNNTRAIDPYNNGSISLTGIGTFDDSHATLYYTISGGTTYNCTTTLTRKPY